MAAQIEVNGTVCWLETKEKGRIMWQETWSAGIAEFEGFVYLATDCIDFRLSGQYFALNSDDDGTLCLSGKVVTGTIAVEHSVSDVVQGLALEHRHDWPNAHRSLQLPRIVVGRPLQSPRVTPAVLAHPSPDTFGSHTIGA
eukprot:gnl/TRDRNA2_/TRDRNA2_57945_c1_seq1.p1 gnl/TRDRNA2_/TRDRNA2_57945_c1~~gnl/TRDRNA2_/TRDRNA2_57945_c1_seq1.p1  ORF type:complete len:154 (+),score=7.44 gnl/TRDRNA2_/TRDRNA2_57945_c1_seq1:42-464(+)